MIPNRYLQISPVFCRFPDADGGGDTLAGYPSLNRLSKSAAHSAGIQLQGSLPVNEGDMVCLTGTIYENESGERYIIPDLIAACGAHSIEPFGASNWSLRSALLDGLFVKTWLQVKPGSVTENSFVLTDGSDSAGIKVLTQGPPGVNAGDYVTPIGAAGIQDEARVIYRK